MEHLVQNSANYVPLSPISFLQRASIVYGERVSIVYGSLNYTWKQTYERCCKLASALNRMNVSNGHIVAALGPNIPELYELHFAIPMTGAIISPLNICQDSSELAVQLKLLEPKLLFVDYGYLKLAVDALEILTKTCTGFEFPEVVLMLETNPEAKMDADNDDLLRSGYRTYQSLIDDAENDSGFEIVRPKSEFDAYSIVFTSGTTGEPKGVVHSHRGTYLTTLAEIILNEMKAMPVFLWTVPMYHCNGWCFTWAIAALGGTNICLRKYDAKFIFDAIIKYNVTNLGGATPVLSMIANSNHKPLPFKVNIITGGTPPQAHVVYKIEELGFILTHSYGMSEMLGPGTVYPWRPEYGTLPLQEQAIFKALHGLNHMLMEAVDVKDPETMESVPFDGLTIGEVMFRGNTVTKGYYKNPERTRAAFEGGWYHTGDMAVRHPDGNIEVKDRKPDLIVSGDKQISTMDVEGVLFSHPAVFEAGVVGKPDEELGQTVCAFVRLKEECKATGADEIIDYCRGKLPEYMVPKMVVFENLPFTSTGKLKKTALREMAKSLA
ncbi:acyl activating enzyme 1 [Hibiscus trionum]|uniref:Acyl activating enzyme 1 n=1 Tax=Hibiscus trionum TaxID=183268 RepID=A0A9W7MNB7_HIBTR|nr:acyl activating enzyme 1 [Hibiscus trionum]